MVVVARLTQDGHVAGLLAQPEGLEEEREGEVILRLVLVALGKCWVSSQFSPALWDTRRISRLLTFQAPADFLRAHPRTFSLFEAVFCAPLHLPQGSLDGPHEPLVGELALQNMLV